MTKRAKALMGLVGFIAVLALAVAVIALIANKPTSYSGQIAQLHHDIGSMQSAQSGLKGQLTDASQQISTLQSDSQAGAVADLRHSVNRLNSQWHTLTVCIPQVQTELNDLSIQTSDQNGFLTGAFVQDPAIISHDCTKLLNGT